MNFRKDINGLRAIAVIAVVIFHFNESWLIGGFAGVDVFFVISGYLMTKIIISNIEKQNFSVISFYLSRGRRIIPALAFMISTLLIFGWFYLPVVDYFTLSKHSISSLGFFSNLYYLGEAGYFDVSSHKKWLLHTWSLSVEWQFYMLYPIIMLIAFKFGSKTVAKNIVRMLCIISFIYCVYLSYIAPDTAFYILPTRAWEMLVGGIAYLYPLSISVRTKKTLEISGISLILIAYFSISQSDVWPGYLSLLPVTGAYLLILANNNNSKITGNIIMQYIGTYSYSIYLWHWPIVLAFVYFGLSSAPYMILGMLLSFVIGYLSYSFIEKRSLFQIDVSSMLKTLAFPPILISLLVCFLCFIIYASDGIPSRLDTRIHVAANESQNRSSYECQKDIDMTEYCIFGKPNNIVAIILGDSHSKALATAIVGSIKTDTEGVLLISASACPFILGAKITVNENCFKSNISTIELIKKSYSELPIFIINRTSVYIYGQSNPSRIKNGKNTPLIYFDSEYSSVTDDLLDKFKTHYKDTMCNLAENNTVYITTPVPEMLVNVPDFMSNRMLIKRNFSDFKTSFNSHLKRNKYAINLIKETKETCGINILNTEEYLCSNESCKGSINGRPIYFDGDHLSEFGNKLLTPMFKGVLSKKL